MLPTSRFALQRRLPLIAALATALLLAACGGAGSTSPTSSTNVVPVSIKQLSGSTTLTANTPYVTVTICAPGGTSCQSIPNVLVDTGSQGLRLFAGAVQSSTLNALPSIPSGSGTLASCAQFASGYMWGSMRQAVVQIGGETTASAIPIQLMGDASLPPVPSACTTQGGTDFSSSFASVANGILGISNLKYDCGSACAQSTSPGVYYACTNSTCTGATAPLTQQGINPIAAFANDNNGSILALPGVPLPNGAASANGTLTFGINTQTNNTLSGGQIYPLDSSGNLSLTVNGTPQAGFVDSGSNGYYLALSSVATCSSPATGFYCPAQAVSLAVGLQLASQAYGPAQTVVIGNAQDMFKTQNTALPALGGTVAINGFVDLGLPFFYGRSIATGLEGTNASAPNGYLAY